MAFLLRLIVTTLAVVAFFLMAPAIAQAGTPIFAVQCPVSHRAADDPIVFPGQRGAAHMHDFSGNWTTRFDSTFASLLSASSLNPGTTCSPRSDTAPYWVPTLYRPDNTPVNNTASTIYYVPGKATASNPAKIKTIPAGLKMIADMNKSGAHGSGWHCGDGKPPSQGGTLSTTTIPNCNNRADGSGGIFPDNTRLQAKIVFPDCWNGRDLDSSNHRAHMAYSGSAGCPTAHPVPIPRLNNKVQYNTFGGSGFKLSSGTPSTMHADFWNTWNQAELDRRVKYCLNEAFIHSTRTDPCTNDGSPGPDTRPNPAFPSPSLAAAPPFKGLDVKTTNRPGGIAGRMEPSDAISFSFSRPPAPSSLLGGWDGASPAAVTLWVVDGTAFGRSGDQDIAFVLDGARRITGLGYVKLNGDFVTGGPADIAAMLAVNGNVARVALGGLTKGALATSAAGTMLWTASPTAKDLDGNAAPNAVITESGTLAKDF